MLSLSCPPGAELRCAEGNNGLRCCCCDAAWLQLLRNACTTSLIADLCHTNQSRSSVHVCWCTCAGLGWNQRKSCWGGPDAAARCCGAASCERLRAQSASHGPFM